MSVNTKARKAAITMLGIFTGILVYKALVHGGREALLFVPLVALGLMVTFVVYLNTRRRRRPSGAPADPSAPRG